MFGGHLYCAVISEGGSAVQVHVVRQWQLPVNGVDYIMTCYFSML